VRRPIPRPIATDRGVGVIWLAFPLTMFPFAEQHVSSRLLMLNGRCRRLSQPSRIAAAHRRAT
jgi:hypothetical protein